MHPNKKRLSNSGSILAKNGLSVNETKDGPGSGCSGAIGPAYGRPVP